MIKKRETCLYCGEKMESVTAKKKFCCPLHRVYWNRQQKLEKQLNELKEYNSNPFVNAARGRDANGVNLDEMRLADKSAAAGNEATKKAINPQEQQKHKLWKPGDPPEHTNAFYLRYECKTYDELQHIKNQSK